MSHHRWKSHFSVGALAPFLLLLHSRFSERKIIYFHLKYSHLQGECNLHEYEQYSRGHDRGDR